MIDIIEERVHHCALSNQDDEYWIMRRRIGNIDIRPWREALKMAKEKSNLQTSGVVFHPRASFGMQRGIVHLVSAIRPTLGPIHGKMS